MQNRKHHSIKALPLSWCDEATDESLNILKLGYSLLLAAGLHSEMMLIHFAAIKKFGFQTHSFWKKNSGIPMWYNNMP